MSDLLQTPLHDWHAAHGGRMVEFGGWHMPVQYRSITEEHHAVRRAAGLFDIAHMGRLKFSGPDSERFLDHLLTNDVASLKDCQVRYSLVCNEMGGVLDDVLVTKFDGWHLLVVNASNRLKIVDWIERQRSGFDVQIEDKTSEWSMLALQGPKSVELLSSLIDADLAGMKYYFSCGADVLGVRGIVSRTGYTGEDGFEVIASREHGVKLWEALIERGASAGLLPCGLGCRDTLRLEAAMPLYGHELSESLDPISAGLSFAVKPQAKDFIGKAALLAKPQPPAKQRVGLVLAGRRIAREGAQVLAGQVDIGEVTSGTFSPTLEKPIAMAYLAREAAILDANVEVDIRGQSERATIVKLPFYRRPRA
ncbi:MAG: glycine cleavage system aminomethyltransferase GcvT [Planctomycetaceae bacterium]|nr:glycine cleavage system aminomethyltransferase GcvT [Planctomycetaceae bacterium]